MNSSYLKVFVFGVLSVVLGATVGFLTVNSVIEWYPQIAKPTWTPPNWLFGPVWSILYAMIGAAFGLLVHANHPLKRLAMSVFIIQFIFNLCWSIIFFNLNLLGWAFIEIIILTLLVLATILISWPISKWISLLLVPYLLWISFATVLSGSIYLLNR